MQYTYKGQQYVDYPSEITLGYPEREAILRKPLDEITIGEARQMLFYENTMRLDCEALIKQELARQWGKTREQLEADKDANPYVINNCLMFLAEYFSPNDTISIVVELLCQSEDFLAYNNLSETYDEGYTPIASVLYSICSFCAGVPQDLTDFLLRNDVTDTGKATTLYILSYVGCRDHALAPKEEICKSLEKLCDTLIDAYAADKDEHKLTSDNLLLSLVVDVASSAGAPSLRSKISSLYSQHLIDETIISEDDAEFDLYSNGCLIDNVPSDKVRDLLLPTYSRTL